MHAISIIVEDCSTLFEDGAYSALINQMVSPIFRLIDPQQSEFIKSHAIYTINMLIISRATQFLYENMGNYAKHLLTLQNDPSLLVRWRIIQGITNTMELCPDFII